MPLFNLQEFVVGPENYVTCQYLNQFFIWNFNYCPEEVNQNEFSKKYDSSAIIGGQYCEEKLSRDFELLDFRIDNKGQMFLIVSKNLNKKLFIRIPQTKEYIDAIEKNKLINNIKIQLVDICFVGNQYLVIILQKNSDIFLKIKNISFIENSYSEQILHTGNLVVLSTDSFAIRYEIDSVVKSVIYHIDSK